MAVEQPRFGRNIDPAPALTLYGTMGSLKMNLELKSVPREDMLAPECVNYCRQVAMHN